MTDVEFIEYAKTNDLENVLLGLSLPNLDVISNNYAALNESCHHGFTDIVKALLDDGRNDPSEYNGQCGWLACVGGNMDVIKLLIEDDRLNTHDFHGNVLKAACEQNNWDVFHLVFESEKSHNDLSLWAAFAAATSRSNWEIASYILNNSELITTCNEGRLFESLFLSGCTNFNPDLLDFITSNNLLSPSFDENKAILKSDQRFDKSIVNYLKKYDDVLFTSYRLGQSFHTDEDISRIVKSHPDWFCG